MAAILKFKMENEGDVQKIVFLFFGFSMYTRIDKKLKKSILARISSGNKILDI